MTREVFAKLFWSNGWRFLRKGSYDASFPSIDRLRLEGCPRYWRPHGGLRGHPLYIDSQGATGKVVGIQLIASRCAIKKSNSFFLSNLWSLTSIRKINSPALEVRT